MQQIVLATGNTGKQKELRQFFAKLSGVAFVGLDSFSPLDEPDENAETFEENALIKARYYHAHLPGTPAVLAEDSGLILSAFPGKFGIRTRREIDAKDDMDWLTKFLEMLEGENDRQATFYSAIAYKDGEHETVFLGTCSGEITPFPQAPIEKGVPVSSVFLPEGYTQVFSALSKAEKNRISHRGVAAQQMEVFLANVL